ncbi:MAG TPA: AAA family ATPase [Sphaerochaeta sp.]|nr:AAA family ATPase [Sphaerochaeta sp.]
MEIPRNTYVNALINRMNNGMIKTVTGIRRSGKSYLLFKLFYDYLISTGVTEDHIIQLALDSPENKAYRNADTLYEYILSRIENTHEQYFVLLDEVQYAITEEEMKNPEKSLGLYDTLNGLLRKRNVDTYITGSNSKFLSSDILTEFRGRGDEVHIFPLSFKEFMQVFDGDKHQGWSDYIMYGGLPLVSTMRTVEQKVKYLTNLFEETYLKDLINRYHVQKSRELEDLMNILASNIGSLTNPSRIEATFKSVLHSKISINTINQYIGYLKDAFIIHEANRYDVKGRQYIGTPMKYYFEDIGLRNARLGFRQIEENHIMENIIYNELRVRGFSVDIGVVEKRTNNTSGKEVRKKLEVDFVANLGSRRYYVQSALVLGTREKIEQEQLSLENIPDSFKKIIVVGNETNPWHTEQGTLVMGVQQFLLDVNSLEL